MEESNNIYSMSSQKTKVMSAIGLFLLITSVFVIVKTLGEFKRNSFIGQEFEFRNTVSVSGEGEIFAVPDIANINFTVTKEATSVKEAQDAVTNITKSARAMLKENGVNEKDIKTTSYRLNPRYEYASPNCINGFCPPGERTLVGHEVSESILVKVRKVDDAGKILGGLGEIGVTNVGGPDFTIDDADILNAGARKLAIADAKAKAEVLATDLGVSLGNIISFNEGGGYGGPIYARTEMLAMDASVKLSPTPELSTGELKITSNVSITYEIK